ncbi:MAG: polysaccharide biosynthesis/export family protein [Marinicellaceae bacterium]
MVSKISKTLFLLITLTILASYSQAYNVAPGDVLRLEVYGEPELAMDVTVDATGVIEYPFVDKINVAGRIVDDIKNEIVTKLKDGYFINPQVTVFVKSFKPFFIQGEVNSPGSYSFELGLTVRKAIALAGGLTERASKKKIYLTKSSDASKEEVRVSMDQEIESGDVILIKESFF